MVSWESWWHTDTHNARWTHTKSRMKTSKCTLDRIMTEMRAWTWFLLTSNQQTCVGSGVSSGSKNLPSVNSCLPSWSSNTSFAQGGCLYLKTRSFGNNNHQAFCCRHGNRPSKQAIEHHAVGGCVMVIRILSSLTEEKSCKPVGGLKILAMVKDFDSPGKAMS